jgi:penicillin-binding protein 1A
MVFGIFMIYVKTTLAPSLDVDASEYSMNLSSIIYYKDRDTGDWKELQTLKSKENRVWVDYDQMPKALWQAAVSIEDKRFFTHHGVDWSRTATATFNMFFKSRNTYGGSTITQQLIKNMTQDNQGTVKRKVTEIFRALAFEKKYSKQEILELYLNTIYLGNSCYGVQTAAQYYFGKDVSQLTTAECACLIGITNNPSMYSPMRTDSQNNHVLRDDAHVKKNKDRQESILEQMEKQGYLDKAGYDEAAAQTLSFNETAVSAPEETEEDTGSANNSFFVDQVIRDVVSDLQEKLNISEQAARNKVYYGGYHIYTTVDPEIQGIAEDVYENDYLHVTSAKGQALRSGITIVDVTNGSVVAMVGDMGKKTGDMVWNFATDVQQCGSSIKPVSVYAPALDAGVITMASSFDNYPVRLLNGKPWPKNSPAGYTGFVTLSAGVANSINTVAVRTIEKLGLSASYSFLTEKLGFTTLTDQDKEQEGALGLGGLHEGVTTEEMAAAYASFANNGVYNSPRLYTKVTDAGDKTVLENKTESHVAMKESTAYFMNELLQGVVNSGTGRSAKFSGMALAGKTGTTTDNYDRYFVGYSPYYCAAVWTGYKNNEKIVYSGNPSITMWKKVMSKIHENLENRDFTKPSSGLATVNVCADSGLLATDACACDLRGSRVRTVEIAAGTGPTETCNLHVIKNYCKDGKCLAGESCPAESVEQRSFLDYHRTDYGILADDNAYLLSSVEAVGACPVHSGQAPAPGEGEDGNTEQPGGDTTTPTEPGEETQPEEDPANWWNNLWGTGTAKQDSGKTP